MMQDKSEVDYSDGMDGRFCRTCRFFRPATNRCLKVAGIIDPAKWCKLWKRRQ
jgi:hypothetical protein